MVEILKQAKNCSSSRPETKPAPTTVPTIVNSALNPFGFLMFSLLSLPAKGGEPIRFFNARFEKSWLSMRSFPFNVRERTQFFAAVF